MTGTISVLRRAEDYLPVFAVWMPMKYQTAFSLFHRILKSFYFLSIISVPLLTLAIYNSVAEKELRP